MQHQGGCVQDPVSPRWRTLGHGRVVARRDGGFGLKGVGAGEGIFSPRDENIY